MPKQVPNKENVPGKYYCTDPDAQVNGCIRCALCYTLSPDIYKSTDDGAAYVWHQPENEAELALAEEGKMMCPVESICSSGDEE